MIDVHCQCGTHMQLGDEWAGKIGRCPQCGIKLRIGTPVDSSLKPADSNEANRTSSGRQEKTVADVRRLPAPPDDAFAPPKPATNRNAPSAAKKATSPAPPTPAKANSSRGTSLPSTRPNLPLASDPLAKHSLAVPIQRKLHVGKWRPSRFVVGGAVAGGVLGVLLLIYFTRSPEAVVRKPLPNAARSEEENATLGRAKPEVSTDARPSTSEQDLTNDVVPPSEANGAEVGPSSTQNDSAVAAGERTPPTAPQVARTDGKATSTGGLKGVSTQYDDFHCVRIQQQHGVRIPLGATQMEVDGDLLPISQTSELLRAPAPYLLLPRGSHWVRWRSGELPVRVEITSDFGTTYAEIRRFFDVAGQPRHADLLARSARAFDVHHAPFLLNVLGASYADREDWAAAERQFRRALRINPAFGPAHLNLAYCFWKSQNAAAAEHELRLAAALNVGNVFGFEAAIVDLRRSMALPTEDVEVTPFAFQNYAAHDELDENDKRLSALMRAMSKYSVTEEDRGKILNNLAVHFQDTGRIELALDHFRESLAAFRQAGPDRFKLAKRVLGNMENACRHAGYAEVEDYRWMQGAVTP